MKEIDDSRSALCCRLCLSEKLFKFLDLGHHPPSDQFKKEEKLSEQNKN